MANIAVILNSKDHSIGELWTHITDNILVVI